MVTLILGIGNFALAVILALFSGWGYYGVAAAGAFVLTFKNAVFTPWYATKLLGVGPHTFTRAMVPGVVATIVIAGSAAIVGLIFPMTKVLPLLIAGGTISSIYILLLLLLGLNQNERDLFLSYLPENIQKYF
jgi:membrane protein EpsK